MSFASARCEDEHTTKKSSPTQASKGPFHTREASARAATPLLTGGRVLNGNGGGDGP